MSLVTFDQGCLGHPQVKPTSCLTNLPLMTHLHGLRCESNHGEGLKRDLGDRMKQTSGWSVWAPGLKRAIRVSLMILLKGFGIDDGSLKKVWDRDQWVRHFRQGHRPFRRDCRSCLMDMGSGKPHRRRVDSGSSAWSMGVDIVQFPKTIDETTGNRVAYSMVATLLVPDFGEEVTEETARVDLQPDPLRRVENGPPRVPQIWPEGSCFQRLPGVGEKGASEQSESKVDEGCEIVEASWGEGLDESEFCLEPENPDEGEEGPGSESEGLNGNPQEVDDLISKCSRPVKARHVTVVFPMESRASTEVIHALNSVTTHFKAMGLPILRMHCDKARELIAKPVQRWASGRQIHLTTTGGQPVEAKGQTLSEAVGP